MILNSLKREIELSKKSFLIFFLLMNSLAFLFMSQVELGLIIFIQNDYIVINSVWLSILGGALVGLVISIFTTDKITDSFKFLKWVILICLIILIIEIPLLIGYILFLLIIFFFINSMLYVQGFIIFFKLFLKKTSITERGRVLSILLLGTFVSNNITFFSIYNNLIIIFPIIFIGFSLFYLEKKCKDFTPLFQEKMKKLQVLKKINPDSIIFAAFLLIFGFTAGFTLSILMLREMLLDYLFGNIILIFLLLTVIEIIICLFIGIIFDSVGRYAILSVIIMSVAVSTYLGIFQLEYEWIPLIIAVIAYITVILAIPLLIGDTSKKESFGRDLAIYFLILIIGIAVGVTLREITNVIINNPLRELLIVSNSSLICCIFSVLIMNSKRYSKVSYSFKERQWKDFLIHIYIIHINGLLVYEKSFISDEDKSVNPLLISGGLVGLLKITKAYFHSKESLRTIDHGDRKIMFKFNKSGNVMFVIILKEDLFILRKKLKDLIDNFDSMFEKESLEEDVKKGKAYQASSEFENMINSYFGSKANSQ